MDNRIALVTGASRGLGRALAAGLAREGYDLILDARNADDLNAAADEIRGAVTAIPGAVTAIPGAVTAIPGAVTAIPGDVTDPAHRAALFRAAHHAGRLDLLVNNA